MDDTETYTVTLTRAELDTLIDAANRHRLDAVIAISKGRPGRPSQTAKEWLLSAGRVQRKLERLIDPTRHSDCVN